MMRSVAFASSVGVVSGAHYAVLVAGSKGYGNYRHQADVCHSYQVVKAKGIPAENIIVMAYDDIANSGSNPFPGKLFNKPTAAGVPGVDVYAGCKIDYSGSSVTPENFMKVLTGEQTSTGGKTLKSTTMDNVFVFFSDHGAPGLIAFPSSQLHKDDLQTTFNTMHSKGMYNKLTFYLETCESGSMFQGMTTPGVYALSASNPTESSWGTYCGSDAKVNGKSINSCLGDLFSVSWMEDSDAVDITKEDLQTQFQTVKTRTSKSAVMQWGDLTFTDHMVSEFQGATSDANLLASGESTTSVSARQIDLSQAYHNYVSAQNSEERLRFGAELQDVLKQQLAVETAYNKFLEIAYPGDESRQQAVRDGKAAPNNKYCELAVRESFTNNGDFDHFSGFALQFHQIVVNACADSSANGAADLVEAAKQAARQSCAKCNPSAVV